MIVREGLTSGMRIITTPNMFPLVKSMETIPVENNGYHELLQKTWYIIDHDNMVWLKPNQSKQEALEQYIKNLDIVSARSKDDFPHGVKKRAARIASKYNFDLTSVESYTLKEDSKSHASYNYLDNEFKIVPEYFVRQGSIRLGDSPMIPEFEKTFVHEFGHAVWHQVLSKKQKVEYLNIIPKFETEIKADDADKYTRGFTNTLDGIVVHTDLYTPKDEPFVSDYARFNPKEDFAESWAWYNIAPENLKKISKVRYDFMKNIHPMAIETNLSKLKIDIGDKGLVGITDLVTVDLQYNSVRRELARKFEKTLMNYISDVGLKREDVKNVVIYGDYIKIKPHPENIKGVVVLDGLKDADAVEIKKNNIRIWVCGSQPIADNLIYEFRGLGDDRKKDDVDKGVKSREKRGKEVNDFVDSINYLYEKRSPFLDVKSTKKKIKKFTEWGYAIGGPIKGRINELIEWSEKLGKRRIKVKTQLESDIAAKLRRSPEIESRPRKKRLARGRKLNRPYISKYKLKSPRQSVISVQRHHAEKAGKHYDLRIAMDKVAYSFALPKGMPKKGEKRLAVLQPPHSIDYMAFHGDIKRGRGKGKVILDDIQGVDVRDWGKKKSFTIYKGKNKGHYDLVPYKKNWLMSRREEYRKPIKKQHKFSLARLKYNPGMMRSRNFWMAPILHGSRYMMYIGKNENRLLSRKVSKKYKRHTERTENVPHLRDLKFKSNLKGTVLDGEMFIKDYKTTSRIMGSSPIVSRMKQGKNRKPIYMIFDVLKYKGKDVRELPYRTRRKIVKNVAKQTGRNMRVLPIFKKNKERNRKKLMDQGWKGIILYDKNGRYGNSYMSKRKR